jgi:hypothetical protein
VVSGGESTRLVPAIPRNPHHQFPEEVLQAAADETELIGILFFEAAGTMRLPGMPGRVKTGKRNREARKSGGMGGGINNSFDRVD